MTRILRTMTALIASGALLFPPAFAEDSIEYATKPNRGLNAIQHNQLDTLFDALRRSKSKQEAQDHEQEIWRIWMTPDDSEIGALMDRAMLEKQEQRYAESLQTLDTIVSRSPKYAEAWNQRALVNYQLKQYETSLEDIAVTLKLEPRHFGALVGRSRIYLELGKNELAEESLLKALRYHPYLPGRGLLLTIPADPIPEEDLPFI